MRNDDETEEMNQRLHIPKKKPDGYIYPDLKPLLWGDLLVMVLSIILGLVMRNFLVTAFFCIPLIFVIFFTLCLNDERKGPQPKDVPFVRHEHYDGDDIGAH